MEDNREKVLHALIARAEKLGMQQQSLAMEIRKLREELRDLALTEEALKASEKTPTAIPIAEEPKVVVTPPPIVMPPTLAQPVRPAASSAPKPKVKTSLEEFIGTNLLNKLGIAAVVIGLGIGAKYGIDHGLITPLMRSVIGYLCGATLIGLAIRLKPKHAAFSAVLLSGGMAVLYFMTYVSYADYDLIPRFLAFALMVLFTAFTVYASLQYNMKVIAVIGLVGAYAVPFMLSDGSGQVAILFSYMTIINTGILVLSFKKDWKILYYTAFGLTWLIFLSWFVDRFDVDDHLWLSLTFSTIFFITFYISFLAHKLLQQEPLRIWDVVLLLLNTFLYYGLGYYAINSHEHGELFLGVFTVFNAILHFVACYLIYKRQDATRDTFYLVAGMVLVFLTLAVPVQLDGHWVTIIWALEGLLMFWIGRTKKFPVYERISYGLVLLTFGSLLHDWETFYPYKNYFSNFENAPHIPFLFNVQVLSSLIICASWGAIVYLSNKSPLEARTSLNEIFGWAIRGLFLFVLFITFYKEVDHFWQQRYFDSAIKQPSDDYSYNIYNENLKDFGRLWLIIYSSLFTIALALINFRWIRDRVLSYAISIFSALILLTFIVAGLYSLYNLRTSYIDPQNTEYYVTGIYHIAIRYIGLATVLPLLWVIYRNFRLENFPAQLVMVERLFFHFIIIVLLSSELISTLDLLRIEGSDRLALSILWGVYGLGLIIYGLKKDEKFIRIAAFVIFGVTLIKLLFYDMAEMSTISKTMVMVILGSIFLIASFIYNKFKASKHEE